MCDLDASPSRQVPVEVELLLQLEDLVSGVGRPLSFWLHAWLVASIARARWS